MQNHTSNTEFNSTSLINPVLIENELRILDTELAQRLGFSNPLDIRKLIRRHEESLKQMGVFATVAKTRNPAGGRPSNEFYLNRKQAIFITAKSETSEATDITIEIIERFDAYERGEQPKFAIPKSYSEALRLAYFLSDFFTGMFSFSKASLIKRLALSALLGMSFCFERHSSRASLSSGGKRISNLLGFSIQRLYDNYVSYVNNLTANNKYGRYVLAGVKGTNFHTSPIINAIKERNDYDKYYTI